MVNRVVVDSMDFLPGYHFILAFMLILSNQIWLIQYATERIPCLGECLMSHLGMFAKYWQAGRIGGSSTHEVAGSILVPKN